MEQEEYQATLEALHDYEAQNENCLSFKAGDILHVITTDSSGWWDGVCNGQRGWFPSNYVQVLSQKPTPAPTQKQNSSTQVHTLANVSFCAGSSSFFAQPHSDGSSRRTSISENFNEQQRSSQSAQVSNCSQKGVCMGHSFFIISFPPIGG
jgi:hypothetical protein